MITKKHDENLHEIWDKRWRGSEEVERLTFLGRIIFKAKKITLANIIEDLPIENVIDIGCGLGHTMEVFEEKGFDCIGVDISPNAITVCKNKGQNVTLKKVEDVLEQYDLVFSDGMLEHFLNFESYAKHLMRISQHYVLLIQPNHDSFLGKSFVYLSELFRGENVFEYNYRIKDFIAVFNKNGFQIIRNYPIFYDVFRLLLFKKNI